MGRNDQQLIKSEVSHDGAHHFEMSVVHGIECPSVCCYATFAHHLCSEFRVQGSGFRVLFHRSNSNARQTRNPEL